MSTMSGLRAIVTGGASGIGAATTRALLDHGVVVAVLDPLPDGAPAGSLALRADIRSRDEIDAATERVLHEFGGLDILVNNAGVSAVGTVADNDDEEWARVLDINVTGMARMTSAALPALRLSNAASVVNVCSIAARSGLPQRALYSASKGAVLALTLAMATDHVGDGVRVNCVSPGTVHTPFVDRLLESFPDPVAERAAMDARQAIGRMIDPHEVARAIVFLCDPASGGITGTELLVDGGFSHVRSRTTQSLAAGPSTATPPPRP
jgi:NAD(P)-dependent dehydrogenase (short-subunit alcohol dehydrogenase family)